MSVPDWVDVAPEEEFAPGSWRTIEVDGIRIAVFNIDGACYAIEDVCTHDGGTLTDGRVEGDEIVCARHGARFSIKSGAVLAPPAYEDVNTFAVRVHQGMVQVRGEGE